MDLLWNKPHPMPQLFHFSVEKLLCGALLGGQGTEPGAPKPSTHGLASGSGEIPMVELVLIDLDSPPPTKLQGVVF